MKKIFIPILFLLAALTACVDEISLNLDTVAPRVVISSRITTDTTFQTVMIHYSTAVYDTAAPPAIRNARVLISDGTQTWHFVETPVPVFGCVYMSQHDFYGEEGKTYTMDVELVDYNGNLQHYTATSTMPVRNGRLDSVSLEYIPKMKLWGTRVYAQDSPEPNYYMFRTQVNSFFLEDKLSMYSIIDDDMFNGNYITGAYVKYFDNEDLEEDHFPPIAVGDTLMVEMHYLNKDYYTFINDAQVVASPNIPIFSGPPSNVKSNISNGALGYFATTAVSRAVGFASPKDAPR